MKWFSAPKSCPRGERAALSTRRWSWFTSPPALLHHEAQQILPPSSLLGKAPINLSNTGLDMIRNENPTEATVVFVFPHRILSHQQKKEEKMTSWVKLGCGSSCRRLDAGQVSISAPRTRIISVVPPPPLLLLLHLLSSSTYFC